MRGFIAVALAALIGVSSAGYANSRGGQRGGGHSAGGYGAAYGTGHGGAQPYGAQRGQENYGPPSPYEFSYNSQDQEGAHGHSQSSDGRTVRGHYMIQMADGTMRRVEYHADESGFHAKVVTNELGTESKNPADVIFESSAITGEQAALQYGSGVKANAYGGNRKSSYGAASQW